MAPRKTSTGTKKPATRKVAASQPTRQEGKQYSRQVIKNKVIKSKVSKDAMSSANPFAVALFGGGSDQSIMPFAREDGRRGAETIGLSTGPISTNLLNASVARKRSRYAILTNPYAKRAIDVWVSNVVGSGHKLVSLCPDKELKKQIEDLWAEWGQQVDAAEKLSFAGMEALSCRSMFDGGECFVRLRVRRPEDGLVVPLQLQLFESEQIPIWKNERNGQNAIIAGIEFGTFGKILNYHMFRNHPGEFVFSTKDLVDVGMDTVPVPARDVRHIHDMRRPNEVRGLPLLSQSLVQLSDLDRYLDAELVRKKAAALIGGFIKQPLDAGPLNPFITEDGGAADPNNEEVHIEALEPGSFPVLPQGYDVEFSEPADVGANFKEFMKHQLLMLAASVNLTYEQLTGDPSLGNERTIRANMLEFKRIAEQYQRNIIEHQFCRPIFDRWFDLAVISGAIKIPPGLNLQAARKVRWIADPWDYLNPQQEVNTKVTEIRAGLTPRSEEIIRRGGVPEDVDEAFRQEREREKENDLVFTSNAGVVSDSGVAHSTDPSKTLEEDSSEVEDKPKGNPFNKDQGGDDE